MKESIRTLIHNDQVVMLINGVLAADFPPEAARQLAMALNQQAAIIENEKRNRENVIDQAILMRSGSKIGLMADPKAIGVAFQEAQWNRDLRRFMKRAPGVESKEVFGIPTINREANNA